MQKFYEGDDVVVTMRVHFVYNDSQFYRFEDVDGDRFIVSTKNVTSVEHAPHEPKIGDVYLRDGSVYKIDDFFGEVRVTTTGTQVAAVLEAYNFTREELLHRPLDTE